MSGYALSEGEFLTRAKTADAEGQQNGAGCEMQLSDGQYLLSGLVGITLGLLTRGPNHLRYRDESYGQSKIDKTVLGGKHRLTQQRQGGGMVTR